MKKLSKLIAVVAALAMAMAMSSSVFAVENPSPEDLYNGSYVIGDNAPDGYFVEDWDYENNEPGLVSDEIAKQLTDDAELTKILEDAGYGVPEGGNLEVFYAADLKYYYQDEKTGEITEKQVTDDVKVTFFVGNADVKDGQTLYVLHFDGQKWDVQPATVYTFADGLYIDATFDSLSPVAILKLTVTNDKGEEVPAELIDLDATKKSSPDTGM